MGELLLLFLFPLIIGYFMIILDYKKRKTSVIGLVYVVLSIILLFIGGFLIYSPKEYGSLGIILGPIIVILSFVGVLIVLFKYINKAKDKNSQIENNFQDAKEEYMKSYKERSKNL